MAFPTHKPSGRSFDAGDYSYKTFKSQSGKEVRILYGDKRTGMKLQLQYQNIDDTASDDFIAHYDDVKGRFQTFTLPTEFRSGFEGTATSNDAATGNKWRYDSATQLTQVRPGISTVTVNLIGVL